jgi:GntR family transcriptional regulator, rspAB operon transcriptional repressor
MSRTDRVYAQLKRDIISCALPPGEAFSEVQMGRRYRASRTPVREACRLLENEGLIVIIPFRGYFIAPLTVADFHNLQEVQSVVDPAAAALAARRATPEQLKTMETCAHYEYQVGVPDSYHEFLERNLSLHVGIAQASGNSYLTKIVSDVHTRLMRFFYLGLSMDSYGTQLVKEHCEIVEAIRAGDSERARRQAADHVTNTIRRSARLFLAATEKLLAESAQDHRLQKELVL